MPVETRFSDMSFSTLQHLLFWCRYSTCTDIKRKYSSLNNTTPWHYAQSSTGVLIIPRKWHSEADQQAAPEPQHSAVTAKGCFSKTGNHCAVCRTLHCDPNQAAECDFPYFVAGDKFICSSMRSTSFHIQRALSMSFQNGLSVSLQWNSPNRRQQRWRCALFSKVPRNAVALTGCSQRGVNG